MVPDTYNKVVLTYYTYNMCSNTIKHKVNDKLIVSRSYWVVGLGGFNLGLELEQRLRLVNI